MTTILIADDHPQITSILKEYAEKDGYQVILAANGNQALSAFHESAPDLLLLDVMMPGKDGFQVCQEIRKTSNVPIIMVTARSEDYDRIMGLEIGADDYIVKPFQPNEVMARIRAILRRIQPSEEQRRSILSYGNLTIDLEKYAACIDDVVLPLTKKELEILWTLSTNKNKVFSRDQLLNSLWGYDYFGDTRTVDSHIRRLRTKIDSIPHPDWELKTIWGVGYKFEGLL